MAYGGALKHHDGFIHLGIGCMRVTQGMSVCVCVCAREKKMHLKPAYAPCIQVCVCVCLKGRVKCVFAQVQHVPRLPGGSSFSSLIYKYNPSLPPTVRAEN